MSVTQAHMKLADCEKAIEQGLQSVGYQLKMIRDERLYREVGYTAFEDYCQERWSLSRSYVHRQIEASEVIGQLLPIGNTPPTTEGQVRPLVALDPEQRAEAWERATERAVELGKAKPTGVIVADVVREMTQPANPPQPTAIIHDDPVPERRPQSRQHPATFSAPILAKIDLLLGDSATVLDPFAGVGTIHQLATSDRRTVGIELEPEWADMHRDTINGDARDLLSLTEGVAVDAIATSPAYGNRMADKHDARDASDRMTYKHRLGRDLTDGNAGGMQWGEDYRALHADVWTAAATKLISGGVFILNVKDHVRGGSRQYVSAWHVNFLIGACGLLLDATEEVADAGLRHAGDNADKRIGVEYVWRFVKP